MPRPEPPCSRTLPYRFRLTGPAAPVGRMAEEAATAGLPRPEIEDDGESVTVCFRHQRATTGARHGHGGR